MNRPYLPSLDDRIVDGDSHEYFYIFLTIFKSTMRAFVGDLDQDIADKVTDVLGLDPIDLVQIADLLEIDKELVAMAFGIAEGVAKMEFYRARGW